MRRGFNKGLSAEDQHGSTLTMFETKGGIMFSITTKNGAGAKFFMPAELWEDMGVVKYDLTPLVVEREDLVYEAIKEAGEPMKEELL